MQKSSTKCYQTEPTIQIAYTVIKFNSFQCHKNGLTYANECDSHINKKEDKRYMITSIDEEAFKKIQLLLMIKTFIKVILEGRYLNIIEAIYNKPTVT